LAVPGFSASELHRRIVDALAADPHYDLAEVGPERNRLARSYRPTWAVIAAILTAPVFGLGLLFLLVKRTESCDVSVVDGPTSAVMTMNGRLLATTRSTLERAVDRDRDSSRYVDAGQVEARHREPSSPVVPRTVSPPPATLRSVAPAPAPPPPASSTPSPPLPDTSDPATVMRPVAVPEDVTRARSEVAKAPLRYSVRLNDEVVDLRPGTPLFIGRAPRGEGRCLSVGADELEVSKTHLCVWVDDDAMKVRDLHSTNGTSVVGRDGTAQVLEADVPRILGAGEAVHFGGQVLTVVGGA
jgi:hypothetical protein